MANKDWTTVSYGVQTCPYCHKSITLTKNYVMRVHGPANNRCEGSGK